MARYMYSEAGANYFFGNKKYSLIAPLAYDENLKWEETTTYNLGLDFTVLGNKLTGVHLTSTIAKRMVAEYGYGICRHKLQQSVANQCGDIGEQGCRTYFDGTSCYNERLGMDAEL